MRLHHRLLNGGLLLFVVMLGAYSEANPPPGNGGLHSAHYLVHGNSSPG